MSKLLLYGILLLVTIPEIIAQKSKGAVITCIAAVPLMIETDNYTDTLAADHTLNILSGRISIALAPRRMAIISNQYFKIAKPLDGNLLKDMEYRILINNITLLQWGSLSASKTEAAQFPYGGSLFDATMGVKDKLTLQFRWKTNHQILQQIFVYRQELVPELFSYRQKNAFDSLDTQIESKAIRDNKKLLGGFDIVKDKVLVLDPGNQLELLIKKHSLNMDSCICYRLRNRQNLQQTGWKRSGHLLTLNQLNSNAEYTLELRYCSQLVSASYDIRVLPFWFQTFRAKLLLAMLIAVSLLGLPFLFYRYSLRKEKQSRLQFQAQLRTVQSQLNPHFVYNALSSIEGLVTDHENEKANEYLNAFSDIMRSTLRNSGTLFIPLADDIAMLEKYIRIEQLRFEFCYSIELDPDLDLDLIEFPPMLLQPSLENAVKHGVAGMGKEGLIELTFKKKDKNLYISIKDNGKRKEGQIKEGHGTAFTKERIKNLKKLYKKNKMEYAIVHQEKGTIVSFCFGNWL